MNLTHPLFRHSAAALALWSALVWAAVPAAAQTPRPDAPSAAPATGGAADSGADASLDAGSVAVLFSMAERLLPSDPDAAETILREIVQARPYHYRARVELGRLLLERDPAEAVRHLRAARRVYDRDDGLHYLLGQALEANGDLLDAAESYRQAIRLNPRHYDANARLRGILRRLRAQRSVVERAADAFYDKPSVATLTLFGRVVMQHAEPRQAVLQFEEVADRLPELPEAWLWVARARHAADDTAGEIAAYQSYLERNPEAVGVRLVVVRRMLEAGYYRRAERALAALDVAGPQRDRLSPAQAGLAAYLLSRVASARGDAGLAGERLLQAAEAGHPDEEIAQAFASDLALHHDAGRLWLAYAEWQRKRGQPAEAVDALQRAALLSEALRPRAKASLGLLLERDQAPDAAHVALGEIALAEGDRNEALRQLEAVPPGHALDGRASLLRGRILREQGVVTGAVDAFLRYVLFQPTPDAMRFARGHVLWVLGNQAEALALWREVPQALEAHPDVLRDVAAYWRREGDPVAETQWRERLARVQPGDYGNRLRLGDVLLQRGYRDDALGVWERLLEERPRDAELLERLGRSYLALGRTDKALPYLRRAVALKPLAPELNRVLAPALYAERHYGDALEAYWQLYQAEPDHPDLPRVLPELVRNVPAAPEVRRVAARMAVDAGNLKAAAEILQGLLVEDDAGTRAERRLLAEVYLRMDQPEAAEEALTGGGEPGDAEAQADRLELLADVQRRMGNRAALAETLGRLQALHPDDRALLRERALLLVQLGRAVEARPLLEQALADATDPAVEAGAAGDADPIALRLALAQVEQALDEPEAAAEQYKAVLAVQPDHSEALRRLIALRLRGNDLQAAIPLLERWVADHPRDAEARYNVISAYLQRFRKEDARPHYEALQELDAARAARLERYFQ